MSFRALRNARKVRVGGPTAKAVYLTLCDAANDATLACTLSVATIAARSETSTRTVRRVLARLEAAGLLYRTRMRRTDGSMGVYAFVLRLSPAANVSTSTADQRPSETTKRSPVTGTSGQSLAAQVLAVEVQAAESSDVVDNEEHRAIVIAMAHYQRWTDPHDQDELERLAVEHLGKAYSELGPVERARVRVLYVDSLRGLEAEGPA